MKKLRFLLGILLLVSLCVASLICSKGILEVLLARSIDSWLSTQPKIYTSQLTDSQSDALASALHDLSNKKGFIAISRKRELLQSGATLYTFSTLDTPDASDITLDPLALLGTTVIDSRLLRDVSNAAPNSYAGYGAEAFSRVADLPSVRSGLYLRVDRLDSGADLGSECMFVGPSDSEFQTLVENLSAAVGVSADALTTRMSGSSTDMGLLYWFSGGAFILLSIVLCLSMTTRSLLGLRELGVHLMLGWSRTDFACEMLSTQARQSFAVMPMGVLGALAILDGFALTRASVGFALASMLPVAVVTLACTTIATIPLLSAKPVEAICGRYSRRGFYLTTMAVYLLCVAAIFGGCLYIDQPLDIYAELGHTRTAWGKYENWSVVRDFTVGGARFKGDPMRLSPEMYAWYAEHEHEDGVYLSNASHVEATAIRAYMPAESSLTPEPFWYLAASPSYLRLAGINIPKEAVEGAERGTRVYLLPQSLGASETKALQEFLMASQRPSDSDIVTAFTENPQYEFVAYDADRELFTWSTDSQQSPVSNNFVIAVITAHNMIPFESESLVASGLENGYIKLDERAASRLLDNNSEASLGGTVGVHLTTVGSYIDGLQKSLGDLFALFSTVLAVLVATIAAMVTCTIDIVNRMNTREISVKYVLGFGAHKIYGREIAFVTLSTMAVICASALLRCNAGLLVGVALMLISNLAILCAARQRTASVVLETVSGE